MIVIVISEIFGNNNRIFNLRVKNFYYYNSDDNYFHLNRAIKIIAIWEAGSMCIE